MKKMIKKIAAAFMAMALVAVGMLAANKAEVSAATGTKWIIAGDKEELFGKAWNPAYEDNAMADTDADGVYTKVYTAVAAGTYSFKVTNGTWDEAYGAGKDNYTLVVETTCDVTISFDTATDTVSATGSGVSSNGPTLAETYYVRGSINGWSASANQMTDNGDGTYTATFTDVETTFEFKIAQDAPNAPNDGWYKSWGAPAAGQEGDNNTNIKATVTAKSDVTIKFTPAQDNVEITVTPVQDDDDETTTTTAADDEDDDETTTTTAAADDDDETTTTTAADDEDDDETTTTTAADDEDDENTTTTVAADDDDDENTTTTAADENGNGAGGGTGSGSVDDTPAGDNSMVAIFAILAVLAAAGVVTVAVAKRRAIEE